MASVSEKSVSEIYAKRISLDAASCQDVVKNTKMQIPNLDMLDRQKLDYAPG